MVDTVPVQYVPLVAILYQYHWPRESGKAKQVEPLTNHAELFHALTAVEDVHPRLVEPVCPRGA
jgi:hypothetical protein